LETNWGESGVPPEAASAPKLDRLEIDLAEKIWTIPSHRMKAGREHRVPLSDAALGVLAAAAKLRRAVRPDAVVFPRTESDRPLPPATALSDLMRRLGHGDVIGAESRVAGGQGGRA